MRGIRLCITVSFSPLLLFPLKELEMHYCETFEESGGLTRIGLTDWLINAFNGEWVRLKDPHPKPNRKV